MILIRIFNLRKLVALTGSIILPVMLGACGSLQTSFGLQQPAATNDESVVQDAVLEKSDTSPEESLITRNQVAKSEVQLAQAAAYQNDAGFDQPRNHPDIAIETARLVAMFEDIYIEQMEEIYIQQMIDQQVAETRAASLSDKMMPSAALPLVAVVNLETLNDPWHRLQQGMAMDSVDNNRVQAQLNWYLDHRAYLDRVMNRAKVVLPFILDELEKKDLPTELALLPIVESAYQTFAYSHGRASGMWQIIPSTGRFLGLKQNWWYDGRRDIIESTHAAIKYLSSLSNQFDGDWELALASYNAGPGRIRSAVRYNKKKGRPTDFWHLTKIRQETRDYVPKLLALKELFEHPERYDFEFIPVDSTPPYQIVELKGQIDLALAADLAGITINELYQLNPAFNRWATAPEGPHRLLIPRENTEQFEQALARIPDEERINWIRHKIKPGETLSQISRSYRTTTSLIVKVNKIRGTQIRAGKYLMVPTATKSLNSYKLSQSSRISSIQNTKRSGVKHDHIVRSGQSLWSISREYNVTTSALAKWNGIAPIDTLRVGQKLVVWTDSKAELQRVSFNNVSSRNNLHALRYTVRKGDSLSRIADRFNIRVSDIKRWNNVGKYLQPGQKLKLYVDVTQQSG